MMIVTAAMVNAWFYNTRPKTRFPTCPAYQNMTFPYTYLAEDRAKCYANK